MLITAVRYNCSSVNFGRQLVKSLTLPLVLQVCSFSVDKIEKLLKHFDYLSLRSYHTIGHA